MATPFKQSALDNLIKQKNAVEDSLSNSPTAYGADTTPSSSDIALDTKLTSLKNSIRAMQGQAINEKWYGPTSTQSTDAAADENRGVLANVLTDISKPLYAVVGGVEHLIGQGTKPGLVENMTENMNQGHRLFGNVLEKAGAPGWVSKPLGFGLDIVGDPIMGLSAGAESLLPRVGKGLIKGAGEEGVESGLKAGLEAAGKGFTSSVGRGALDVASTVGDAASWVSRGAIPKVNALETAANVGEKITKPAWYQKAYKKLSDKVMGQTERYNALTGYDETARLGKAILPVERLTGGVTLGNYVQGIISKIPGGEDFMTKVRYSPYDYNKIVKVQDKILKMKEDSKLSTIPVTDITSKIPTATESVIPGETHPGLTELQKGLEEKLLDPSLLENESIFKSKYAPGPGMSADEATIKNNLNDGLDDTVHIANQGANSEVHAKDAIDWDARMNAELEANKIAKKDFNNFLKLQTQKTGIDWYDKAVKAAGEHIENFKIKFPWSDKDIEAGKDLLTTWDAAAKIFKSSKTTMSLGTNVRNALTNVVFTHNLGADVKEVMPYWKKAQSILSGRALPEEVYQSFVKDNVDLSKFLSTTPTYFKSTYGVNPTMIGGKYFADDVVRNGLLMGIPKSEILDELTKMPDEIRNLVDKVYESTGPEREQAMKDVQTLLEKPSTFRQETPASLIRKAGGDETLAGNPSSSLQSLGLTRGRFMDFMQEKIDGGSKTWAVIDSMLSKAATNYERTDQIAKLGLAMKLTDEGATIESLTKMSRMIPDGIKKADIIGTQTIKGQKYYKLSWEKATDLANEAYMNYSAMPAFVRMMRSVPVLGAPFVSFTYGAIPKLAKTIYHNPASFNEINYAMSEFSGDKSPLELQNMKSQYGSWFNSPGMFRVPFLDAHPTYVNMAGFLYPYSLSTMDPSNRSYKEALPNAIVQTVDKLQLMKDPVGQMIFDNLILPSILPKGERPLTQFGQPINPLDSTALEKVGYATRNLAEAYVPGNLAPLGLVGGAVAPGITQAVPLYNYRKLAEAVQGNKPLGQPSTTDSAMDLAMKNLLSWAGLSYNQMNLSLSNSKTKKKK